MSRAKVEQPDLTSHCGYTNMGVATSKLLFHKQIENKLT